jgi:hypothetical protein
MVIFKPFTSPKLTSKSGLAVSVLEVGRYTIVFLPEMKVPAADAQLLEE